MENHPIPQDITGFEFKLIGEMTLKQFGYLAGGAVLAWIMYILPLFIYIKIPLAIAFVALGAAFAFVPIDGRPLDAMIKHFIKAAFSPTQYVYQKASGELIEKNPAAISEFNKKRLSISEMSEKQLQEFLNTLPKGINKLDKKEMVFFQSLNQYGANQAPVPVPDFVPSHAYANQSPTDIPTEQKPASSKQQEQANKLAGLMPNEDLQKTAALLQKELQEAKAKEAKEAQVDSKEYLDAHQKVLELQKNLSDLSFQKQQLESRLIDLQKQVDAGKQSVFSASQAQPQALKETKNVRSIPSSMTKSVGLPTTPEFPNIITGILKDPRGNPLSNILVEVKDQQANAVRAFKTNALGHFASATPLTNGAYTIEFDDPKGQNKFDTVGFTAKGEIILPIEVISVDTREELRRSLFN
jgi:hypothetical protein